MALTEITVQDFQLDNDIAPSLSAANADGSWFACTNPNRTFIWSKNTSGGDLTVTLTAQKQTSDGATTNEVITIPATTGNKKIGPIPYRMIDNAGNVYLDYAGGVTNLTIGVFQDGDPVV